MKKLWPVILLLGLAISGLGYVEYVQVKNIEFLETQVLALQGQAVSQHVALVSQKKAILKLGSDQKIIERVLIQILKVMEHKEDDSFTTSRYGS